MRSQATSVQGGVEPQAISPHTLFPPHGEAFPPKREAQTPKPRPAGPAPQRSEDGPYASGLRKGWGPSSEAAASIRPAPRTNAPAPH